MRDKSGSRRFSPPGALSLAFVVSLFAAIGFMVVTGQPGDLGTGLQANARTHLSVWASATFLVLLGGTIAAEYLMPARRDQVGISPSVVFDAMYMGVQLPVLAAVFAWMSGPISTWLDANASWLVVDSTRNVPVWLAGLIGLAITDFFLFCCHVLKHKVPLLWRFHMIHHSQARINAFTANRTHPFDAFFEFSLQLVPFFILFPSFVAEAGNVFVLSLVGFWTTKFQHANIRSNLGPLRYLFVTPQSHRVHHSARPDHWNSNFANVFAWDRLFGTQHDDVTSYPPTGIGDDDFPEPSTWSPTDFARSFVGQLAYPLDRTAVSIASDPSAYAVYEDADR